MRNIYSLVLFCFSLLPISVALGQLTRIGTGDISGVYYPVGGQLSLLFNSRMKQSDNHVLIFTPKLSGGSAENIKELLNEEIDFALVQSNVASEAYRDDNLAGKKGKRLRVLFSLYPEYFTVVARKSSNIVNFSDLKGKKVNIGTQNSGSQLDVKRIFSALQLPDYYFKKSYHYSPDEAITALCYGDIDAVIMTVGHPSSNFLRMIGQCEASLVTLLPEQIKTITQTHPFYRAVTLSGNVYAGQSAVDTVGLYSLFITRENQSEKLVYELIESVFDSLERFKLSHPVLNHLDGKMMANDYFDIPVHPGATKYFKKHGLLFEKRKEQKAGLDGQD